MIFLVFAASCDSDVVDRLDDLAGNWQLTTMTYTDSLGNAQTISNSSTTLLLTKEIATGNSTVDGVRYGVQDIEGEEFDFEYSFDFSQNNVDIMFTQSDKERFPADAVGRTQLYQFEQPNDSRLDIFTDEEVYYIQDKLNVLKDVRYIFERE